MSTETSGIEGRKVSAPVDVLADLRSVVRIAKAASVGVTGNAPRIERAEKAIAAVAELIEAARIVATHQDASISAEWDRLDAALANCGGAS